MAPLSTDCWNYRALSIFLTSFLFFTSHNQQNAITVLPFLNISWATPFLFLPACSNQNLIQDYGNSFMRSLTFSNLIFLQSRITGNYDYINLLLSLKIKCSRHLIGVRLTIPKIGFTEIWTVQTGAVYNNLFPSLL